MNIYDSAKLSLYKYCKDFATNTGWTASIYNFDAYAEGNDLPSGDLIGLSGYTLDVDTDLITVRCRVGIATEGDKNLFRLDKQAGLLLKAFMPETRISVYDSEVDPNAPVIGTLLIASGVSVSPVYQAIQKPLKFLAFTAHSNLAMSR